MKIRRLPKVYDIQWRKSGYGIKKVEYLEMKDNHGDDFSIDQIARKIISSYQVWLGSRCIDRFLTRKAALAYVQKIELATEKERSLTRRHELALKAKREQDAREATKTKTEPRLPDL